jgi:hypothetical protein
MTGKITAILGGSCVGMLLGLAALMWSPTVQAQSTFSPVPQVQPPQPAKIDRSLPGIRRGTLTKAQGKTVWIDGAMYLLTPDALVEDKFGSPLPAQAYQADGVEYRVQYWLGTDHADRQITQMIISFPE